MRLRTRLLVLSVSTVALIVAALVALYVNSLTRYWVNSAVESSTEAGRYIQSQIVARISDTTATPQSLDETKRDWNRIVSADGEIASTLVEQTAVRADVIVQINVIGEDGNIVASSIPSRVGQRAPVRKSLTGLRDSGSLGRLTAILSSRIDYESRISLGIPDQPNPVFQIQLLASPVLMRDKILPDLRQTAFISLLALLASVVLAGVSAQLALRPVRRIGRAIDTLATGNPLGLTFPREEPQDQEVAAVEYKLSLLGEQMQGARRDADQMRTAIGSLARGVAHEIKNPLNAIALRLETLRMRIADEVPEAEGEIDVLSSEVQRLDRVVRTFLDLNRPMEPEIREFDPVELAAGVLEIMRPAATQSKVELRLLAPAGRFMVHADRGLLEQGLLNIVNNAIQALGNTAETSGPAVVTTSVLRAGTNCEITVIDNGPGMPSSVREKIFEPWYTTKATGSGIGLAFTKRAMDLHKGSVTVESSPGQGTTFVLSFPVIQSARV